ncbi:heavy-metal-associated domain-containing protein [Formosa maritima]|uniref:Heavy-metal-associated domain-containing protein n=1 Tax=Formosa maritima TaxID=2592046 RepID=A0A5D0GIA1_9FLAO|nr:heavy-metal-associated domain-containing protein [Formosa maritima]TYA58059.1 heavy-metal-associated domain-containing protein [Formosa maritima]
MRTTLHIQNINCGDCLVTITNKLSELKHISNVIVNPENETVSFEYNSHHDFDKAKHVLSMIGYPVIGPENML